MKRYKILAFLLSLSSLAMAREGGGQAPKPSSVYDPFAIMMIVIMLILLLVIILLAQVVIGVLAYHRSKEKRSVLLPMIGLLLFATPTYAQGAGSISPTAYYFMLGVIGVELLVIFTLLFQLRNYLKKERAPKVARRVSLWSKMNQFRPVEQEAQIDLGHDYDGIRELDNRLPPWWLYGFYVTIIFSVVYLWRYHVSHTAPSSAEELAIAMQYADRQKAAYLKKTANNVDENTVKLLTDANEISAGEKAYVQNCAACHGKAGEGMVGPNLTDDYWLHGGSLQDVFKSVKYGWAEKGMRSWKDDLSPIQIAQVSSYIKSLHGTNPANAKEKQGELYTEK